MVEEFGNSCAFDSVVNNQYCDSINYMIEVDGLNNMFLKFITGIVKNGISAKTYFS